MKFKHLSVALAVSAALGTAGVSQQAHADAMAQAKLAISNFVLTGLGTTPLSVGDFGILTFLDTLTNTAILGAGSDFGFAASPTFAASVDAPMACVGACAGIGQNNYTPALVPPTSTYSRSDSLLKDAPISGTGFPVGVEANNIAETSLQATSFGGATTDIILTSTFTFAAPRPAGTVGLSFDADTFLRAWTSLGTLPPTSAGADFKWQITLKQGGITLIDWLPDGSTVTGTQTGLTVAAEDCNLNKNAAAAASEPNAAEICSGSFLAHTSIPLLAGVLYSFTITQHATSQAVNVAAVPEPDSLALLGIGLLGLGAFAKRRYSRKS